VGWNEWGMAKTNHDKRRGSYFVTHGMGLPLPGSPLADLGLSSSSRRFLPSPCRFPLPVVSRRFPPSSRHFSPHPRHCSFFPSLASCRPSSSLFRGVISSWWRGYAAHIPLERGGAGWFCAFWVVVEWAHIPQKRGGAHFRVVGCG